MKFMAYLTNLIIDLCESPYDARSILTDEDTCRRSEGSIGGRD